MSLSLEHQVWLFTRSMLGKLHRLAAEYRNHFLHARGTCCLQAYSQTALRLGERKKQQQQHTKNMGRLQLFLFAVIVAAAAVAGQFQSGTEQSGVY